MRASILACLTSASLIIGASDPAAQSIENATGIWQSGGEFMYSRGLSIEGRQRVFWYRETPNRSVARIGVNSAQQPAIVNQFLPGLVVNSLVLEVPKGPSSGGSNIQLLYTLRNEPRNAVIDITPPRQWAQVDSAARAPITTAPRTPGSSWSGLWFGNDGGIYYVNHDLNRFGWFGEACSAGANGVPPWANVFFAEAQDIQGAEVRGLWADVPYGVARGGGRMTLSVSPSSMRRLSVTGGFGGSEWRRISSLAGLQVSELVISFRSGDDGNRESSADFATVELGGGRTSTRQQIDTSAWGNDVRYGVFTGVVRLPAGVTIGDIRSISVEHDGAPRNIFDTYDNWDIAETAIRAQTPSGGFCIGGSRSGIRLTGQNRVFRLPLMSP